MIIPCTPSARMVLLNIMANMLARVLVKVGYNGLANRVASPKGVTPLRGAGLPSGWAILLNNKSKKFGELPPRSEGEGDHVVSPRLAGATGPNGVEPVLGAFSCGRMKGTRDQGIIEVTCATHIMSELLSAKGWREKSPYNASTVKPALARTCSISKRKTQCIRAGAVCQESDTCPSVSISSQRAWTTAVCVEGSYDQARYDWISRPVAARINFPSAAKGWSFWPRSSPSQLKSRWFRCTTNWPPGIRWHLMHSRHAT